MTSRKLKRRRKKAPRKKRKETQRLTKVAEHHATQAKEDRVRKCIVTGEHRSPREMVRFVVSPSDDIVPDIRAKLPGRGCWVTATRDVLAKAVSAKAFSKAARQSVRADATLIDLVDELLGKQVLNLLGLARRGGQVDQGFAKVEGVLRAEQAAALFEARDGSADGRGRLRRIVSGLERPKLVGCFTSEELSLALGRENVVHAALKDGGVSARILEECNRLQGFRPLIPGEWSESPMALKGSAG